MALALYRRHRRECKAGHPEDSRTSEYDERKKGWKRCECPILVSGTLIGRFRWQNTGKWEWDDAKAVLGGFENAGSWADSPAIAAPVPPSGPEATSSARIAIPEATKAYLAKCQNRSIQPATLVKYQIFTRQLNAFAVDRGYVFLDQFTVADMDCFYSGWADGIRSKAKKLDRLKSFVKFSQKRKWLTEDITSDLEAPAGASVPLQKAPFTDEELDRIYGACEDFGSPPRRNWTGEDARDFVNLLLYTGLRISDVATFDISKRLNGNDVFLRMHKTFRTGLLLVCTRGRLRTAR